MVDQLPDQPHQEPENPFFRAWAEWILKNRVLAIVFLLALTGVFVYQIKEHLVIDNSIEAFFSRDSDTTRALEEFRDVFGHDAVFMVMAKGNVFSLNFLRELERLQKELEALDLPLKTLGERAVDREKVRRPGKAGKKARAAPKKSPKAQNKAEPDNDGGFSDFEDDFDEDFDSNESDGFTGFDGGANWGPEEGGHIVEETISLLNVRRTRAGPDGGINVGKLMDPFPTAKELPALKKEVLADPTLVGQVISQVGRHAVIIVRTQFMSETDAQIVHEHIKKIADRYNKDGFETAVSGLPALASSLNSLMLDDMRTLFVVSILVQVLIMFMLFRHAFGIVGPITVVILAIVWAIGAMAVFNLPMTMITNILPAFIICVAIGDSVHLQSVYRDLRRAGLSNHEAIVSATATTGMPILFTTLTTMFGLLSFRFASVEAIQELGAAGAFGVAMAMVHTLVVLPVILSMNKKSFLGVHRQKKHDFLDRFLEFCASLSGSAVDAQTRSRWRGRRQMVLLAGLILGGIAINGAMQLRVWHNPLSWIPPDHEVRKAFDELDEHMGGTSIVEVVLDGQSSRGVKDLELLQGMDKLVDHIKAYRDPATGEAIVRNALSVLDIVKETNKALHQGDPKYYKLPDTQQGVIDAFTMFENVGPAQLKRLMTLDAQKTHISFRVKWLEATAYGPLAVHIREGVRRYIGANKATVTSTGSTFTLLTTVSMLISDLIRSFSVAFVVITLLMMLFLRSFKLGLVAMVPNLLPIAVILGAMGYMEIPIDMANLLIASVALGIAVDDTIHYIFHFRVHHRQHGDANAAIAHSLKHSGRALVSTSIILSAGFFVFLSATMYSLQRFGALIGATVIIALLVDLILTPALLRTVFQTRSCKKPKEQGESNESQSTA